MNFYAHPGQQPVMAANNYSITYNNGFQVQQPIPMSNSYSYNPLVNNLEHRQLSIPLEHNNKPQKLLENLKKENCILHKICNDFEILISQENFSTYLIVHIFSKRNNTKHFKNLIYNLYECFKPIFIFEDKVAYFMLQGVFNKEISDDELINKLFQLSKDFIVTKIIKDDFIKINNWIIPTSNDNFLEKIEKSDYNFFLKSPEQNQLIQDFSRSLNNDSRLFIDEKTLKTYSYDSLPLLRQLKNHLEEVKDYVEYQY